MFELIRDEIRNSYANKLLEDYDNGIMKENPTEFLLSVKSMYKNIFSNTLVEQLMTLENNSTKISTMLELSCKDIFKVIATNENKDLSMYFVSDTDTPRTKTLKLPAVVASNVIVCKTPTQEFKKLLVIGGIELVLSILAIWCLHNR
jgi:hypothetical protein